MRPRHVKSTAGHNPHLMMVPDNTGVTGQDFVAWQDFQPCPSDARLYRAVVSQSLGGQWTAGERTLALPHGEDPPVGRDNLLPRLHIALGAVLPDENRLAPSRAIVLRRSMHQVAVAESDYMYPVAKRDATVRRYQRDRCRPDGRLRRFDTGEHGDFFNAQRASVDSHVINHAVEINFIAGLIARSDAQLPGVVDGLAA